MKLYGEDLISVARADDGRLLKLVINESAAYLFPCDIQHRDATQPGLCYQDDSEGNALAATIRSGRIDVRYHHSFSDERVRSIMQLFLNLPQVQSTTSQYEVFYQGRMVR